MGRKRIPLIKKIQSHINILDNSCWEWIGKINKKTGYGQTHDCGKHLLAHRASYETYRGKILGDLTIDHLCRNRRCVNPLHLEIVSLRENVLRGNGIAGENARKKYCLRGHLLGGHNVYNRKDRVGRCCKECQKLRTNKWLENNRRR